MSEAEDIKDVVREINRSQITGPLGQSKVVRFYSKYNGKPLKDFKERKILPTFKNIPQATVGRVDCRLKTRSLEGGYFRVKVRGDGFALGWR